MEVKVIASLEELETYVPAWDDLAAAALEPNPFYESWMLLPALRNFSAGKNVRVALVLDNSGRSPVVCGLFPLQSNRHYMGVPVSTWSLWKYNHCPLTAPLIREQCAREVVTALFDWLSSRDINCQLLELRFVPGEGALNQLLVDQFNALEARPLVWEWFTRALFKPMDSADRYLSAALSGKHRKAFRRRAELLAELGKVEYTLPEPDANIGNWIQSFLRIEASGWKGREGSAMACREADRRFFTEVVTNAFGKQRLMMPAMLLNGNPIAQNCYFTGGRGSFHFKPAFDEEYARFSPGFHMECEMIRHLHSKPEIEWLDSCTTPTNEMYNRLFLSRRTIQSLLVPIRQGVGGLVVSTMPFLRSLKRTALSVFEPTPAANGNAKTQQSGAVL